MNSSLIYWGASHVWCLVRFWTLLSLPTLIFFQCIRLHFYLLYWRKPYLKKIETVTLTSLITKMKSVDVFDEKIIRSTTSGFKHLLNWHQVLPSKLMYFKIINELFDYSVVINCCQGISMNCNSE